MAKLMKMALIAIAAVLLCACTAAAASKNYHAMFEAFKSDFQRSYGSAEEESMRRSAFITNMLAADALSAANPLARFGPNNFSDLTAAEFQPYHSAAPYYNKSKPLNPLSPEKIEDVGAGQKMDWRSKGAVTNVKNQGPMCGSCWAFSATGNMEGQWFLAGNSLTSLSEQELVSCGGPPEITYGGCKGSLPDHAFKWVIDHHNGAIVTEASYPYVSGLGSVPACNMNNGQFGARISSYNDIPQDEDKIASYVYKNGPVSIGVDASSFQTYTGGIMTNCENGQLDHGVLIVGFDDTNSPPYWIVKNSWGASWGENGYIRLQKGTNQCGLDTMVSSSVVNKNGPQPPAPTPTNPQPVPSTTTAPKPSSQYAYYKCEDTICGNCKQFQFAGNQCVNDAATDSSFRAVCIGSAAGIFSSFEAASCNGASKTSILLSGKCNVDSVSGTSTKLVCPQ